jgi:hypothetical protein
MSISSYTAVTMLDSRPSPITLSMPKTTDILNRVITFKDLYGSASTNTITFVTRSGDTFEDGTFSTIMSNTYQTLNFYAGQPGKWLNVGGSGGGSTAGLTTVSNNLTTVSNSVVTNMGYLTSVSNSGVTNTGNITTVSNSVVTNMGYLTSVSNSGVTNTGNITAVSNAGVTTSNNLTTVSNTVAAGRFTALSTNTISTNIVNAGYLVGLLPGNTAASSVSPLAVGNGNGYLSFSPQIEFQYYSGGGYKHFMGSRHNGSATNSFGNAIDFWLYSATGGAGASTTPGTCNVNTMSVTAAGVGIFNNSPSLALDVAGAGKFTSNLTIFGAGFATNAATWTNGTTHTLYGDSTAASTKYIQWAYNNTPGTTIADGANMNIACPYVGINQSAPTAQLHVKTSGSPTYVGWDSTWMIVTPSANAGTPGNTPALGFGYSVTSNTSYIASLEPFVAWRNLEIAGSNIYLMTTDGGAGNVGINTRSPAYKLDVAGSARMTSISTNSISTNQLNSSNISNVTNQYFQYGGSITASIGGTGGQQGFLNISYPAAGTGHTNDGTTYIWGGNANGDRYINLDSTNIGITVPKGYGNIWLNANTINVGTFDMYSNIIFNVSNLNFITGGSISNVNVTRTAALSTNTISTASITAGGTINITSPLTNCTGEIYASGGAIRIVGSSTTFDLWNYCSLTQVSGNLTINSYSNVTTTASSNININATSTIYISSGGNAINLSGNIDINNKNISNVNITQTAALSTQTISTNSINTSSINGSDLDLTATSINMHTSSVQQYLNFVPVPQPVIQFGSWSGPAAGSDGTWGGSYETITITDYNNTNYCIYITGKNNSSTCPSYTAVPLSGYSFSVYLNGGDQTYSNVFYWQTMGNYGASAGPETQNTGGGGGGPH